MRFDTRWLVAVFVFGVPLFRFASMAMLVGFVAHTGQILTSFIHEGHLPALSHIMKQGAHASLESTIPPMTAPAWTSASSSSIDTTVPSLPSFFRTTFSPTASGR